MYTDQENNAIEYVQDLIDKGRDLEEAFILAERRYPDTDTAVSEYYGDNSDANYPSTGFATYGDQ